MPAPPTLWLTLVVQQTAELLSLLNASDADPSFPLQGLQLLPGVVGARNGEHAFLCGGDCKKKRHWTCVGYN